jgi:diguanylate cyclase (GGDEF)-like protein/PAS domain S-box-containing protein
LGEVPSSLPADRFARFFALSGDLMVVTGSDGRVLEVNDAWATTLGWSPDELLGEPLLAFVHPDDVESTQHEAAILDEHGSARFANRCRASDGGWRWLEWVAEPHADEGVVYAVARDVTDIRHQQRLVDHLPDTVVTKTDRDLVVTYVGGGALRRAGVTSEELVGRRLSDVYEADSSYHAALMALHERALQGEAGEMHVTAPSEREYELRVVPLTDAGGTIDGTMAVATHVTPRVAAERENRQLAALVAATAEAILSVDLQGRIRWVNARAGQLYGCGQEALLGRPLADLIHGDAEPFLRAINEASRAGEPLRDELEHVDRFGRIFPVEVTVSPLFDHRAALTGRSVLVRDISERKAAEERLSEADRRFEQALLHAPCGMALVGLDGSWMEVNDALCRLAGYTHEELLGKTFVDITHPDDVDADVALREDLVLGRRDSYEMEKRYVRKDGSEIWILLTVSVVRDQAGHALHFISQVLDIDERKRAELHLREAAEVDQLTGVLNRRRFTEILSATMAAAWRHPRTDALLFVDLDGFKAVNDLHGHAAGDELLRAVAAGLQTRLRSTDIVGRYGGDEFVVLLQHTSEEDARKVTHLLDAVIRRVARQAGGGSDVTASIGMTMLQGVEPATAEAALELADAAMYRQKIARLSARAAEGSTAGPEGGEPADGGQAAGEGEHDRQGVVPPA